MIDLLEKIRRAKILAREQAVVSGVTDPNTIHMVGVFAAEDVVIAELKKKESLLRAGPVDNVIPFPKRK